MLVKDKYNKVLYITVSTGIGAGIIINQTIDPDFADSSVGQIMIEHNGKEQHWENFASGKAIVEEFGKLAHDIHDARSWKIISKNIAEGLLDLIAVLQPEVIIIGGSIGVYYRRYAKYLKAELKQYENPMMPIPHIMEASRPEDAVVYGCYDLAKATYG
jgi:predicted NBD/HSP70 family sugar kinase